MDEDWCAITEEELRLRVLSERALFCHLSDDQSAHYDQIKCEPFGRASIFRSEAYGEEHVFVLARSGQQVVFFDDDEDEFAVGTVNEQGKVAEWGLCGELVYAIKNLLRNAEAA